MSCDACSCTENESEPLMKNCTKSVGGFRFRCSDSCCLNCNRPERFPVKQVNPIGLPIENEVFEMDTDSNIKTVSVSEPIPIIGRPFEELKRRIPTRLESILQGVRVNPGTFTIQSFVTLAAILMFLFFLSTLAIFA